MHQMDQNLNAQIVAGHNSMKLMISEMMASMKSDVADLRKAKGADSWDQGHDPVPPCQLLTCLEGQKRCPLPRQSGG